MSETRTQLCLDVEIYVAAQRNDGYPVRTRVGKEQEFEGILDADLLPWTASGEPERDGRRLFDALLADAELRRAWERACGQAQQRRIRLWIDKDAPDLHALPWEVLHDGDTWLAASAATPFSRYLPSDTAWGGLVTEHPIHTAAVNQP